MSQLQKLQFPHDQAIFTSIIACIPKQWVCVKLEAVSHNEDESATRMIVKIDAMGQLGIALVSDLLENHVRELFLLHTKLKTGLQGINYTYRLQSSGKWAFVGDYDYK